MTTYHILLGIQYASIVLMLFMCAYITKKWRKPVHGWLFFYCMATLINNAGYLALMHAQTEAEAVMAWQFCYLGRVWIPFSLLQFVLWLGDRKRHIWVSNMLACFHALVYCLVLMMKYNTLYYTSYGFVRDGVFPHLEHSPGIVHYIYDVLVAGYIVYGFVVLYRYMQRQANPRKKKQLICIMAAIATDSVSFVLKFCDLVPGYDVTALGYTLATLPLYYAMFRYDMLGTKELARDFIIDRVSEGVIVTDEDGTVMDVNRKAKELLPEIGTRPQEALERIRLLIEDNRTLDVGERKYTPKMDQLLEDKHAAGRVYMLTDDTQHYRHAEQLTREMMLALSKTVDAKDHYTNGHSERVAKYAKEIARRMGKSPEEQEKIYEMGLLHDIGKIGVAEEIINKAGRLTDEEFAKIKEHTVIGCSILRQITVMPELADGARSHHERYNGKGYPDGLAGEEIPEPARIICLADCYDAMTSTRTYSKPKPQADVRAEIERCSGSQFDPEIAKVMIAMIDDDTEYMMHE